MLKPVALPNKQFMESGGAEMLSHIVEGLFLLVQAC